MLFLIILSCMNLFFLACRKCMHKVSYIKHHVGNVVSCRMYRTYLCHANCVMHNVFCKFYYSKCVVKMYYAMGHAICVV